MILAKAYQIDNESATGIVGGAAQPAIALLDAVEIGSIKHALEADLAEFKMDGIEVTCVNLEESAFQAHTQDKPFALEVQSGDVWDHANNEVLFYGVIDPGSVSYDPATRRTGFTARSWHSALAEGSDVQARSVYRTIARGSAKLELKDGSGNVVDTFEESAVPGESAFLDDAGGIAPFLGPRTILGQSVPSRPVLAWSTSSESGGVSRSVQWRVRTKAAYIEKTGPAAQPDSFDLAPKVDIALTPGESSGTLVLAGPMEWEFRRTFTQTAAQEVTHVQYGEVVLRSRIQYPARLVGLHFQVVTDAGMVFESRITAAEPHRFGIRSGLPSFPSPTFEGTRLTLESNVPVSLVAEGEGEAFIFEKPELAWGTEVEMWSGTPYGADYLDTPIGPEAWGASGQHRHDGTYSAAGLLRAMLQATPSVSSLLAAQPVEWLGDPARVAAIAQYPDNPAKMLGAVQRDTATFARFEPYDDRKSNGARLVVLRVATRDYLASQIAVLLPVPATFSGQAVGERKPYVAVTSGDNRAINQIALSSESLRYGQEAIGWYPDEAIPEGEKPGGRSAITLKSPISVPVGGLTGEQYGADAIVNDDNLREVARRYWRYAGSFWRKKKLTLAQALLHVGEGLDRTTLVGRLVTVETGEGLVSGIVSSASADYLEGTTEIELLTGDAVLPASPIAPKAVISGATGVPGSGTPLTGLAVLSAARSISPSGLPLSFTWKKNGTPISGETDAILEAQVVSGDVIALYVDDGDGGANQVQVTMDVYLSKNAPDTNALPDLDLSFEATSSANQSEATVVASSFKLGGETVVQHQVIYGDEVGAIVESVTSEVSVTVPRPLQASGETPKIKTLRARAFEPATGLVSPWQQVPIDPNPQAEVVALSAFMSAAGKVQATWSCDTHTADDSVTVMVWRTSAQGNTLETTLTNQPAASTVEVTLAPVPDFATERISVEVLPKRNVGGTLVDGLPRVFVVDRPFGEGVVVQQVVSQTEGVAASAGTANYSVVITGETGKVSTVEMRIYSALAASSPPAFAAQPTAPYAVTKALSAKHATIAEHRITLASGAILSGVHTFDADRQPDFRSASLRVAGTDLYVDLVMDEDVGTVAWKVTTDGSEPAIAGDSGYDFNVEGVAGESRTQSILLVSGMSPGGTYRARIRPYEEAASGNWAAGDFRYGPDALLSHSVPEEVAYIQVSDVRYDRSTVGGSENDVELTLAAYSSVGLAFSEIDLLGIGEGGGSSTGMDDIQFKMVPQGSDPTTATSKHAHGLGPDASAPKSRVFSVIVPAYSGGFNPPGTLGGHDLIQFRLRRSGVNISQAGVTLT